MQSSKHCSALPTDIAKLCPSIRKGKETHVWFISLSAEDLPWAYVILSPDEKKRASAFRDPQQQRWFAQRHAALRWLLSQYLEVTPSSLRFETGPHGKPRLCDGSSSWLGFSLSHRAGMAAVALANEANVGVDVECADEVSDLDQLVNDNCSAEEQRAIASAPRPERTRLFLRQWTRKEALLKAVGSGLNFPPNLLSIPATAAETIQGPFLGETGGVWSITSIDSDVNHLASVALPGIGWRVIARTL
ncbi:MAG: 4'-phosphopantetheinyl transferase superfamily protein [Planctomycetes bacterium]|nr:4'-phosphopantetheinyl transferase superfamily protein [Planctomycetota bacterium]